jgi:general secretion pathway protein F
LVQTGEGSGDLGASFAKLEEHLSAQQELRAAVLSALIYPIFLTLVSGASVLVLMAWVVPRFTRILADTGRPLPLITQILLGTADFLIHWGWLAGLIAASALAAGIAFLRQPGPRLAWDGWKLRWPLLGALIQRLEVVRFSRTLSTLMRAGVPMLPGLRMVQGVLSNAAMAQTVAEAAESLKEGRMISGPLGKGGRFPPLALQMMAVGEETGQLEALLDKTAQTYEREAQRTVKRLISLLEPAVILIMGLVIGFIIIGILLGIVSVNDIPLE